MIENKLIKEMTEDDILNIIDSNSIPNLLNKIGKFYPNGFDIDKIDIRIKKKIKELEKKFARYNNSIEDVRKTNTY